MSLIVKEPEGKKRYLFPQGVHDAVCYIVADLGHHTITFKKDNIEISKRVHQMMIGWELPVFRIEIEKDGEKLDLPRAKSNTYNMTLHKKANLRRDLDLWRGKSFTATELKGFNIKTVLGKSCQLQIVHEKSEKDGNTYANIASIIPWVKSKPELEAENPLQWFSLGEGTKIPDTIKAEWIINKIMASEEMQTEEEEAPWEKVDPAVASEDDDNMPFQLTRGGV